MEHEVIKLEQEGWRALASSREAAAAFYERVLDREPVMLLPGGMVLDDRDAIVASMAGQPWSSYELEELRATEPNADTGLVTYGAVARRGEQPAYSALMSSLYVRRDGHWRLAFHQQTPR